MSQAVAPLDDHATIAKERFVAVAMSKLFLLAAMTCFIYVGGWWHKMLSTFAIWSFLGLELAVFLAYLSLALGFDGVSIIAKFAYRNLRWVAKICMYYLAKTFSKNRTVHSPNRPTIASAARARSSLSVLYGIFVALTAINFLAVAWLIRATGGVFHSPFDSFPFTMFVLAQSMAKQPRTIWGIFFCGVLYFLLLVWFPFPKVITSDVVESAVLSLRQQFIAATILNLWISALVNYLADQA